MSQVGAKKGEGCKSYVRSVPSQVLDDRRSLAAQVVLDEELTRLQMQQASLELGAHEAVLKLCTTSDSPSA